jgi:hypothetical protein
MRGPSFRLGDAVRTTGSVWHAAAARSLSGLPSFAVVGLAVLGLLNLALIGIVVRESPVDFGYYQSAVSRFASGESLYVTTGGDSFNYNPLAAYVLAIIVPFGYPVWVAIHVVAAMLSPRPVGLVLLVTFPWWWDAALGNVVVVVFVFAAWAVRGHGWAIAATLFLALLIPRPLMLPVVAWLLWKFPKWRPRFVLIAVLTGVSTLLTGEGAAWLAGILRTGGDVNHYWNLSPSRFIGIAWIPFGAVLGILLARRGFVGLAALAISPYLLPYYAMFALLDIGRRPDDPARMTLAGPISGAAHDRGPPRPSAR